MALHWTNFFTQNELWLVIKQDWYGGQVTVIGSKNKDFCDTAINTGFKVSSTCTDLRSDLEIHSPAGHGEDEIGEWSSCCTQIEKDILIEEFKGCSGYSGDRGLGEQTRALLMGGFNVPWASISVYYRESAVLVLKLWHL